MVANKTRWAVLLIQGALAAGAVTIENDALRVTFADAEAGFAVTSIENKIAGGTYALGGDKDRPAFFRLVFWDAAKPGDDKAGATLDERTPCLRRYVDDAAADTVFVWEGMDLPGEKGAVDVRARVAKGRTTTEWTLDVANRSGKYALAETHYPCLNRVVKNGEADLMWPGPDHGARLLKAYGAEAAGAGQVDEISHVKRSGKSLSANYLGYQPMVCAFMKGLNGLYIAAQDPEARIKTILLDDTNSVSFKTPVEYTGLPEAAVNGPRYPVTITVFKGDWWQAARLYRTWALRQEWTSRGRILDRIARGDYPARMTDIPLWINIHDYSDGVSNVMTRCRELFPDFSSGIHWHLWHQPPHCWNYPEYFPAQDGVKETIDYCEKIGQEPHLYLNARLWTTTMVSWELAKPYAALKPDGSSFYIEKYGTTPPTAPMCPWTQVWQKIVQDYTVRCMDELGSQSLFLDQIGAAPPCPCYNPAHGHPLGGGTWWYEGYQKMLAPLHDRACKRDVILSTEGAGEAYMNYIHSYLQVTFRTPNDLPFYNAVYSGYTTYFCSAENHEDDDASFWTLQAREFLWGQELGWFHPNVLDQPSKVALLGRLCRARQAHKDFFAFGTLLDELRPVEPLPTQHVTWLGRRSFFEWSKTKNPKIHAGSEGDYPVVLGNWWANAKTGRKALFAVNLTEKPQTLRAALPEGVAALSPLPIAGETAATCTVKDGMAELTIPARGIAAFGE